MSSGTCDGGAALGGGARARRGRGGGGRGRRRGPRAAGGGGVGDGDRTFCEFSMMNSQSWKMREKSALKLSFSFFAFCDVISSREWSKTWRRRRERVRRRGPSATAGAEPRARAAVGERGRPGDAAAAAASAQERRRQRRRRQRRCGRAAAGAAVAPKAAAAVMTRRHLLREQLQNEEVVLAERLARFRRRDEVADEGRPVVRPLLLHHLHEDDVELVHEELVGAQQLLRRRALDHHVHDKVLDPPALRVGQRPPPRLDHRLEDLRRGGGGGGASARAARRARVGGGRPTCSA